jgi:hypothetical protein
MTSLIGNMGASLRGATGAGGQLNNTGFYKEKIPKGYTAGKIQQFSPEQMQLFQRMFSQVSPESYLGKLAGGDESFFNQMEAPALRQFGELQGNIASRFSGIGGGGGQGMLSGQRSSGFQNIMGQAASNFAQDLAARRQSLQQQAIMDLMGLSEHLLGQRPYERLLTEKMPKQKSGLGGIIGAGLGGLGGFLFGGPGGALGGAQMGHKIGSFF